DKRERRDAGKQGCMFVFHLSSSSVAVLAQHPPPAPGRFSFANAGLRRKFRGSKTVPCDNESQCNPGGLIASNAIAVALLRFGDFVDLFDLIPARRRTPHR